MASKLCVFQSESIAYGRSNAGALLLLHSTTAGSMIKSETKLHDSEIYISHSISKTLCNDARLSLIGLSSCGIELMDRALPPDRTVLALLLS